MIVREYTEEFYRVNLRAGYIEDTTEKTARYVNGLRLEILDEISILSPTNIEEAYKSAMKAGEKITRRKNDRRGQGTGRGKDQSYGKGQTASSNEEGNSSRASGSANKGDNARGDQAGQRGAYVAQPEEAKAPPQEAENAPETGEALLLNKVLLKPAKEATEQTQRKALFRTVCKSHAKCCKLIIDSGSIDNLVATKMVEKLELKRLKHPTPYKVSWLQKGHQLLVDEQCEVEFQIGRYKDKFICDIMSMKVCHILLGRPWQYDRKVVHDGLTNCYKFVKDGIKHTLVPIKEEGTAGTKALDLPPEIQQMLQEFTDIVVDELLNKLSPKRSISNHIDFIPGASFPNKAAYRMSPKDNEEIRKQLQELPDKGLIRESLIPYTVPTVLTPKKGGEWRMCIRLEGHQQNHHPIQVSTATDG
eukprot:PITA_34758